MKKKSITGANISSYASRKTIGEVYDIQISTAINEHQGLNSLQQTTEASFNTSEQFVLITLVHEKLSFVIRVSIASPKSEIFQSLLRNQSVKYEMGSTLCVWLSLNGSQSMNPGPQSE